MRGLRFLFAVSVVAGVLPVGACGGSNDYRPYDEVADDTSTTGNGGSGGDLFSTSHTGGEGAGPICDGVCKEWKPAFFEELTMFWIGPSDDVPPCPDFAPLVGSEGYADPIAPHTCPVCSCSPAGCAVPEDMHVAAAICPGDGAPSLAWTSPAWEGACTSDGAIPPGLLCGGVPCAQSLEIGPVTVEACQPISDGAEDKPAPAWGRMARECKIGPLTGEGCTTTGEACVPVAPEGFRLCVHRDGDNPAVICPASYPDRIVVYAGYVDERSCEPCGCGDPGGADCSAVVQVFGDGGCGALLAAATVSPGDPACVDLPSSGAGLGSKQAVWMKLTPGNCTANGGPVGEVVLSEPQTLCCQEPPPPAE